MKIEGVPEGWELVRFGTPKEGEIYLAYHGGIDTCSGNYLGTGYPILKKIEKPKRYRPFASAEEFKPHRDRWIRRNVRGGAFKIVDYCDEGMEDVESYITTWKEFFEMGYVFDDDSTPFGIEVAE